MRLKELFPIDQPSVSLSPVFACVPLFMGIGENISCINDVAVGSIMRLLCNRVDVYAAEVYMHAWTVALNLLNMHF